MASAQPPARKIERVKDVVGGTVAKSASPNDEAALRGPAERFGLRAVSLAHHVRLQGLMVLEAAAFLEEIGWSR